MVPLRYVDPTRASTPTRRAASRLLRTRPGRFIAEKIAPRVDVWLGRHVGARVSLGMFVVPSATLTTTGARTGQRRQAQVVYFHDGRDVIVLASNYGGDRHPQWYHNLVADPDCDLGGDRFRAGEVTDPAEYARLFGVAERYFGGFAEYRAKTTRVGRTIPVLRLVPAART